MRLIATLVSVLEPLIDLGAVLEVVEAVEDPEEA